MEYDAPGISAVYLCIVVVDGTIIYAFSMSTDLDQSRENSLLLHAIQALLSEKKTTRCCIFCSIYDVTSRV